MNKKNENMEENKKGKNINEDFLMIFANTLSKVQKQQIKALNTKDMQVVTS